MLDQTVGGTVYVFRHCVRAVDTSLLEPYTNRTFPSWGVSKDACLPRGLQIMQGVGVHLLAQVSTTGAQSPTVIADVPTRCVDSAHALARGMRLPLSSVRVNGSAFVRCKPPSDAQKVELLTKRLREARPPADAQALLTAIDCSLGGDRHIVDEENKISSKGKLEGKIELASAAADIFLMQYGGGFPIGWGRVSPSVAHAMGQMRVYEWAIDRYSMVLEQAKSSRMLSEVVRLLAGNTTTIFLGHDTDTNGLGRLLDLGWSAPPFADNTTAPNTALRFTAAAADGAIVDK